MSEIYVPQVQVGVLKVQSEASRCFFESNTHISATSNSAHNCLNIFP